MTVERAEYLANCIIRSSPSHLTGNEIQEVVKALRNIPRLESRLAELEEKEGKT